MSMTDGGDEVSEFVPFFFCLLQERERSFASHEMYHKKTTLGHFFYSVRD